MSPGRLSTRTTFAAVALALGVCGCNKAPAAEALKAAEAAVAGAPEVVAYLPEESAAIAVVLRNARVSFDEGRYTEALRAVQPLPDRIAGARAAALKRKQQRAAEWEALSGELPARIEALVARLGLLVSGGWISSERQATAEAEIIALNQAWADAFAESERGEITKAIESAGEIKARAEKLGGVLGVKPAPAPTAAPRVVAP